MEHYTYIYAIRRCLALGYTSGAYVYGRMLARHGMRIQRTHDLIEEAGG